MTPPVLLLFRWHALALATCSPCAAPPSGPAAHNGTAAESRGYLDDREHVPVGFHGTINVMQRYRYEACWLPCVLCSHQGYAAHMTTPAMQHL